MAEVVVAKEILKVNDVVASANRTQFDANAIFTVNMLGSPGGGKTTLLEAMLPKMKNELTVGVIEGDLATSRDADRIEELGVQAVQINTGGGCHLDANMVANSLSSIDLAALDMVFIENVGNLVCTAGYMLGEHLRFAVLSATEGDDKIEKYPSMFQKVDAIIINKTDLLPYTDFDVDEVYTKARMLQPDVEIFQVSARTGEGIEEVMNWLLKKRSDLFA